MDNQSVLNRLKDKFGDQIQNPLEPHDLLTVETSVESIIDVLQFVKSDDLLQFSYLTDITAVHYPNQEKSFAVVYHVHNLYQNIRLRIKVYIDGQNPVIPTATVVWHGANWMERETYDFFGIIFEGHPDLRRILNMDDLGVFPMRKEYPLEDPNRVDKKDFYFGR
ncbi:NADH-quinone oxidoreductase subunit C [Sphingobacterium alkalisoli]|uniref:NADH-quinone oxidoreductase subunit C n=1 Tax=Sphingobacterium alkalisoli TaxID=1874115 RepID=A0A4U0GR60_9SPHI|nr:NADH-quinone oxidoreductase subunit C [Sphingobacterium alkalisoli]TJY61317.1 NADH-quinone oxidoreductase subunit C [Sphingobacterium alkalisoli]GGH31011.1 NADH-quinone oxidoreductase subunit C [Sphingobacterium alkalisoli]